MSDAIRLANRAVIEISGDGAAKFLNGLVTNEVATLAPGAARFGALLSPQGKILADFLIFASPDGGEQRLLLDCPKAQVDDLLRRLAMYRLRAPLTIARNDALAAYAWLGEDAPDVETRAIARDPRAKSLGWRGLAAEGTIAAAGRREDYDAARIAAGVPEGGEDFAYGETFPHEANMDLLAGVDFAKGCYVGQEVVSRMKHRGTARRRVIPYRALGAAPAPGTAARAGDIDLGVTGSRSGERGLALIRLDRLADAHASGLTPSASGVALEFAVEPTSAGA